jgi:hypothetical protein
MVVCYKPLFDIFGILITALIFRIHFAGIPCKRMKAGKIDSCGFFGLYRRSTSSLFSNEGGIFAYPEP